MSFIMDEEKPWESNCVSSKFLANTQDFLGKAVSSLSSHPLFLSVVTFYALTLLYFPGNFLGIVFSPVLISTGILLLTLLRLGAKQRLEKEFNSIEPERTQNRKWVSVEPNSEPQIEMGLDLEPVHDSTPEDCRWVSPESDSEPEIDMGLDSDSLQDPFYSDSFVEWNVRAPLEVIYEEYEGEEDEQNDDVRFEKQGTRFYPVLYYPETDSDSSSDSEFPAIGEWDSPGSLCFRRDEEDREGMIEIALDRKRISELFHVEEDNLIEIDISPTRTHEIAGEKW